MTKGGPMKRLILLILAVSIGGCSTINTLDDTRNYSPNRVETAIFPFYYRQVFYAAEKACDDLGLKIYQSDENKGLIVAKTPIRSPFAMFNDETLSFGEKVAIYVYADTSKNTAVDVVVQKRNLADITYIDWRPKIIKEIRRNLFQHFPK